MRNCQSFLENGHCHEDLSEFVMIFQKMVSVMGVVLTRTTAQRVGRFVLSSVHPQHAAKLVMPTAIRMQPIHEIALLRKPRKKG